jgi:tetratricopeptide (TPR) repeat protein
MGKIAMYLATLLLLHALPVHANEATDYLDLGLKATVISKKIAFFTKALNLDPKLAAAYEKRGMLYYYQRKYDKVIQDYQAYLDLAPEKTQTYRMLGLAYLKSGDYQPAIAHFTRSIELEPQHPGGYAYRAEANRLLGKDEEAIRDSTAAIELRGDTRARSDAYRTRAIVYRKNGLMDLAVADTRSAWQADPRWSYWARYWYKYASPEELRGAGLIGIIALAFVLIFGLKLKSPKKDD